MELPPPESGDAFRMLIDRGQIVIEFGRIGVAAEGQTPVAVTDRMVLPMEVGRRLLHGLENAIKPHEAALRAVTARAMPPAEAGVAARPNQSASRPAPDRSGEQATRLLRLVGAWGVPHQYERSFRMSQGSLRSNRFLLTVNPADIPGGMDAALEACARMAMPASLRETAARQYHRASALHFGFEGDAEGAMAKLYLEQAVSPAEARRAHAMGEPVLLHQSFKWDLARDRAVTTRYFWHPLLNADEIALRLQALYRGQAPESLAIATEFLLQAAANAPAEKLQYLEVEEPENDRRSFDLNLYNAKLALRDTQALLQRMRTHFGLRPGQFQALYDQVRAMSLGHVAGGVHRDGRDFFNVYYGVTSLPVFNQPPQQPEAGPMRATDRFEYATAADPSRNYCLWEYQPPAPPEDKYRAINVLYNSFATAGLDERAYAVVEAIRDAIGPFRTVFGIKFADGGLAWEFYFYDYQRRRREVSITRVLDAIRPYLPCAVRPRESLPYFMFSLDLDADLLARRRELDVVHMYVGNPGNTVSSGIAYAIRVDSTTLENFYFFFDARTQLAQVAGKIASSAVFDDSVAPMDLILVPEYRDCQTICIANKRTHDCVYFSGVDADQLALFLGRLAYPPAIRAFIDESRSELGHLLFDIGFDYRSEGGRLQVLKSGYYGVF